MTAGRPWGIPYRFPDPDHRISRPLDDPQLRVLSLGAGLQSSTLAWMSARGDLPRVDFAVFADERLPRHVKFHLFGVKGTAIAALAGHPRIHSVDSAAWDFAARRERVANGQDSCTIDYRAGYLRQWYAEQRGALGMFGA